MFGLRAGAVAAIAAVAFGSTPAFAAVDLGNLTVVSPVTYTKSFALMYTGSFADDYTFKIDTLSTVSGTTSQQDGYVKAFLTGVITMVKDITVSSISLSQYDVATNTYSAVAPADSTPSGYSFGNLSGGSYKLTVNRHCEQRWCGQLHPVRRLCCHRFGHAGSF
jgi:hypothetical protein